MIQLRIFILFRVLHRIYYMLTGHRHHLSYRPREEMDKFVAEHVSASSIHEFKCSRDRVLLRYRRLGNGKKVILLCNGVGTGFFMWLPILQELIKLNKNIWSEITLIAPEYRGLFGSTAENSKNDVNITTDECVEDIREIMKHAKIDTFHMAMGWSLGAQTLLTCLAKYPKIAKKLFLLNPSTGKTLHSVLQPVVAMPLFIGKVVSYLVHLIINLLRPLTHTWVWNVLKVFAYSIVFRLCLEFGAFFGGFPPEQPVYFHEYMRDTFQSCYHTRGLLDLILSLDGDIPKEAHSLPHQTVIISGIPDIMTGVYHSQALAKTMPNVKHVTFTMGSHFLLMEWPDLVTKELFNLLQE